eukprot:CAMPEP_0181438204 /NCGR_PEP_ID=MMETSP1110-20121109/21789_1 /TAXON_ID=174948 /ORGANISM="Symbiodinium sp., Strain CCMP421" /LENGTH=187 /DNA_ID=CAMNT_0023561885 /DNA_START=63 /DNA_END=627 /DNA_ORIENTATION=+
MLRNLAILVALPLASAGAPHCPDCVAEDAQADGGNLLLQNQVAAHKANASQDREDCTQPGYYHYPNMEGMRIQVSAWQHCQSYCRVTPDCKYFSFWPDGGCQLQAHSGEYREASYDYRSVVSGPETCMGETLPPGAVNYLDASTAYCVKNPTDSAAAAVFAAFPSAGNRRTGRHATAANPRADTVEA